MFPGVTLLRGALLAGVLLFAHPSQAHSIRFSENRPTDYAFLDLSAVPAEFGMGEFSLEFWIRPDPTFPVGSTLRGTYGQLRNWSDADPEPYSSSGWWHAGNWLLDGHTRPRGFGASDTREGTFSLQFYGGGRLRWMFADSGDNMPPGMVYAVQAWPADATPSLLDGQWHHVVAIRRWREPAGATLELWIDGRRIAQTDIALRTDMRRFWHALPHPRNPPGLGGWSFGAEVMTAWGQFFTQYEDYKGLLDDIRFWGRALEPVEIEQLASGRTAKRLHRLLAQFTFDEGRGDHAIDTLGSGLRMAIRNRRPDTWSKESRPEWRAGEGGGVTTSSASRERVADNP
ncbi:MAG TPA: LamG-like jellyroll fold domain-containing protein [Sphingopyxis sp.]|uniref:LamG-like jellyroll fold domain-containing protein n=1 Tax=Sphingopyxis sp. TaxID=1908224 RepID=UPI002C5D6ED2|nr:LamG-like jellyroll fold domain-containing protein [Sphingopyxis sp.]HWW57059.1 LamG-like jellyroll fold domain-containing protein [Sphingopyxis sp.]